MSEKLPNLVPEKVDAAHFIAGASASVRAYCGWHIAPSLRQTITLDGRGGRILFLPSLHVTELHAITIDGRDALDRVRWSADGMIELDRGTFPHRFRCITVDYTHGYELQDVESVTGLVMTIAKRAQADIRVRRQEVGGAMVEHLTAGGAPLSYQLLQIEKQDLAPFRIEAHLR